MFRSVPDPSVGMYSAGMLSTMPGWRCGCALCAGSGAEGASSDAGAGYAEAADAVGASALPNYIASLLPTPIARWGGSQAGVPATITYSFMSASPSYASSGDKLGFAPMTETQRAATRQAFAMWGELANINLVESSDSSSVQIRLGTNRQQGRTSGYAYLPGTSSGGGDIYIANDYAPNTTPTPGSFGFSTLVHEIGHALGLKHPGNYNATGGSSQGPFLATAEDNTLYSVMSYTKLEALASFPIGPSFYDVAAIQYLYGANRTTRTGNDVYAIPATGLTFRTIWDAGGSDTIDASGRTDVVTIDLRPGTATQAGDSVALVIPLDTAIENAIGGAGNDTIYLNAANNRVDGGGGTDIAIFGQPLAATNLYRLPNGAYVASGQDGKDVLIGIEQVQFSAASRMPIASASRGDFDGLEYLASNPDLATVYGEDQIAAANHFMSSGFYEGRPIDSFDPIDYLASNPDIAAAVGSDTTAAKLHYLRRGRAEGRPTDSFNAMAYLGSNPDLYRAFGADQTAATRHYVLYGRQEGRPLSSFDPLRYLASNPDLIPVLGIDSNRAITHYLSSGQREGRSTTSFDALGYLAANPDLAAALGTDQDAAVRHYLSFGRSEGRSTQFDSWGYLASNPELIRALGADPTAAELHYLTAGRAEGRTTTGFNAARYLVRNPELAAALGTGTAALTRHYVQYGYWEGRNSGANNPPSVTAGTVTLLPNSSTVLNTLFSVSDPDGDSIRTYEVKLNSTGTGSSLQLSGINQLTRLVSVGASAIGNLTVFAGTASSLNDQIQIRAYDGIDWSPWAYLTVRVQLPSDGAGNTIATAYDTGSLTTTTRTITDWVGTGDTYDYYKFQATNGQTLRAVLSNTTGTPFLDLYNASGTFLATASSNALARTITATGTYYMRVSGFSSSNYSLSFVAGSPITAGLAETS